VNRSNTGRYPSSVSSPANAFDKSDPLDPLDLPESRWVDVDGPVHYREWEGPADGPVFVCVHGLGGSLVNFALVAPALARHGRTLALDLVGFGKTPPAGRGTDVPANRRILDGFLRALDLPRVVLVGNSMGGMVSVIECARAPQAVEAMILVDAALPRTRHLDGQFPPRVAALFGFYAVFRGVGTRMFDRRTKRLGAERLVRETLNLCTVDARRVDPRLVRMLIETTSDRQGLDYSSRAFMDAAGSIFNANVRPGRYRELTRRAHGPALVIHGVQDRLVPVTFAREAVAWHDDWELVELEDAGHIPQMEVPVRWIAVVEDWLARTPLGSRSARV
jgi:pimeloyl-ACP methyl ester carboxylesterase